MAAGDADVGLAVLAESLVKASGVAEGEGEVALPALGGLAGRGEAAAAAAALREGVTMVGKTAPFKTPPANITNSKQAKIPPYSGASSIALQPFVKAARLKRASPSVGAD